MKRYKPQSQPETKDEVEGSATSALSGSSSAMVDYVGRVVTEGRQPPQQEQQVHALPKDIQQWLGRERMKSEVRQLGGVLIVLGIGTTFSTMALIAYLLEADAGASQIEGFRLPVVVANFLQITSGIASMITGTICLLQAPTSIWTQPAEQNQRERRREDKMDKEFNSSLWKSRSAFHTWSKWMVVIVNTGPIALVITLIQLMMGVKARQEKLMADMAKDPSMAMNMTAMEKSMSPAVQSNNELEFVPPGFEPTVTDINVIAWMGVVDLFSVCSTLIGGLTVCCLQLCAYQALQPHSRNKYSYRGRLGMYSLLVLLGGLSQLILGCYLWIRFGAGPYEEERGVIHIATYIVHIPMLPVFVGTCQCFFGGHGFLLAAGWAGKVPLVGGWLIKTWSFQYVAMFTWLVTMFLQFLFPPAYGADHDFTANGPTFASVYLGFFIMPLYMDHLVRSTPNVVLPETYGLPSGTYAGKPDPMVKIFFGKHAVSQNDDDDAGSSISLTA